VLYYDRNPGKGAVLVMLAITCLTIDDLTVPDLPDILRHHPRLVVHRISLTNLSPERKRAAFRGMISQ